MAEDVPVNDGVRVPETVREGDAVGVAERVVVAEADSTEEELGLTEFISDAVTDARPLKEGRLALASAVSVYGVPLLSIEAVGAE